MHGNGHLFHLLTQAIGVKAAVVVTATAVTVTSGVVGYGGYQAVKHIQQYRQEQAARLEEEVDGKTAAAHETAAVHETVGTEGSEDIADSSLNTDTKYTDKNEQEKLSKEKIEKEKLEEDKRVKRLVGNVKAPAAVSAAPSLENQALLQMYLQTLQNATLSSVSMQPASSLQTALSQDEQSGNGTDSNPSGIPAQDTTKKPYEPEGGGGALDPINKLAKEITPAILYGSNPSIKGISYITDTTTSLNTKKYTIVVYYCGTDLETKKSIATSDLINMLSSSYDTSKVNVLLCAGGTKNWKNAYMNGGTSDDRDFCNNDNMKFNIYELNPENVTVDDKEKFKSIYKLDEETGKEIAEHRTETEINKVINSSTLKLLGSYDTTDMGRPELFAGCIDLATKYYPAENYGTILWNHGGGVNSGICFGDSIENGFQSTGLSVEEMESALAATQLYQNGQEDLNGQKQYKLAFIGFDACHMGSTEIAFNLSPYCDYMVGSSEVSTGGWEFHNIFNNISAAAVNADANKTKIDNAAIGKMLVDEYRKTHTGSSDIIASAACYDLTEAQNCTSKMKNTVNAINESARAALELYAMPSEQYPDLQSELYQAVKQARIHCYTMGCGDSTSRDGNGDFVDLKDFYRWLKAGFDALRDADKYKNDAEIAPKLKAVCTAIDSVLAQDYIIASAVNFGETSVFYRKNGNADEAATAYADFWEELRGAELWGTSLFMPYYHTTENDDTKKYQNMSILSDYTKLMAQFKKDQAEEQTRIKRLAAVIDYKKILKTEKVAKSEITIGGTKQDVFNLSFKEQYDDAARKYEKDNTELTTDPFTDYMDTIGTTTVYVSRY